MIRIESDLIAAFDVDNTLITAPRDNTYPDDILGITDPYTGTVKIRIPYTPNIELMKSYKARGFYIIVWSHAGGKWGEAVVNALNLTDIVDQIQAKPNKLIDDLPVEQGIGTTIFVKED